MLIPLEYQLFNDADDLISNHSVSSFPTVPWLVGCWLLGMPHTCTVPAAFFTGSPIPAYIVKPPTERTLRKRIHIRSFK